MTKKSDKFKLASLQTETKNRLDAVKKKLKLRSIDSTVSYLLDNVTTQEILIQNKFHELSELVLLSNKKNKDLVAIMLWMERSLIHSINNPDDRKELKNQLINYASGAYKQEKKKGEQKEG